MKTTLNFQIGASYYYERNKLQEDSGVYSKAPGC